MIDCRNIDPEEWRGFSRKKGDTLLMAGFPCPSFSGAGNRLGTDDPRGKLLHNAVALHNKLHPDWFLYENVASMKQEHKDMISELIGVEPIEINSNLVSAQNRARLYWTNIPYHGPPQDRGVLLKHILEDGYVDRDKSHCIDANYFKGGNLKSYFEKHRRQLVFSKDGLCHVGDADLNGHGYLKRVYHREGKAPTLTSMGGGNREPKVYIGDEVKGGRIVNRRLDKDGKRRDYDTSIKAEPRLELRYDNKAGCLTTVQKDSVVGYPNNMSWRKLTPLECERLQTLPDGYTEGVSNTQRYKICGNGFTVDVIAHILYFLKIKSLSDLWNYRSK